MNIKERIVNLLKNNSLSMPKIIEHLSKDGFLDVKENVKTVNSLIDDNTLFDLDGKYYLSSDYKEGIVKRIDGYLYVDDLSIRPNKYFLFNGDTILYKQLKFEAECIKVLNRKYLYVLGTIQRRRKGFYFYSDEYKFSDYKLVNLKEYESELKDNYRIRTYISNYERHELKIDKIIGPLGESTYINTILLMNNAPKEFNKDILNEAHNLDNNIVIENRKDLRVLPFVTIDSESAKDFDDAIYVDKDDEGYLIYVSIADVSHYVKEGSLLDKEALERGTSIYYPDNVISMLPSVLCDDLCSLKENQDRLTITCFVKVGYDGEVIDYDIYPSVIKSSKRFTYTLVNKIIDHDKEALNDYKDYSHMLYTAYEASRIIDKKIKKDGIEFKSNDIIVKSENNKVVDILLAKEGKAEKLIEDLMILANKTVATHMYYLGYPLLYRNHDYPNEEKLAKFKKIVVDLGFPLKNLKTNLKGETLAKCLKSFEGREEYNVVSDCLLKSMAKATYSETSIGHFGLGIDYYCHFTSPIRRYPDLMVHRMLKKYIFEHDDLKEIDEDNLRLSKIATLCNESEKRAVNIERAIIDLKCCEYLEDKIGNIYEGIITSVLNIGFYVTLNNTIEGLVHIKSLDGFYEFVDDKITNGINTYSIGDKVKIRVKNVDLNMRNIDYELV